MPDRYRRVVYKPLPPGQEWAVVDIDGEQVIVISEALDEEARKRARRAARASILGRGALLPIPVIAGAEWLRDRLQAPMSAAIVASTVTMTGAYALTEWTRQDPPPMAAPLVVTHTPTAAPTASSAPTRPSRKPEREPTRAPTRQAGPPPTRATPDPRPERTRATPTRAPATRTRQDPPRADPPRQDPLRRDAQPSTVATSDPPVASGPEPTRTTRAPAPPTASPAPADLDSPAADAPPTQASAGCSGIHVGVPLDPLLNLDVCLLD